MGSVLDLITKYYGVFLAGVTMIVTPVIGLLYHKYVYTPDASTKKQLEEHVSSSNKRLDEFIASGLSVQNELKLELVTLKESVEKMNRTRVEEAVRDEQTRYTVKMTLERIEKLEEKLHSNIVSLAELRARLGG